MTLALKNRPKNPKNILCPFINIFEGFQFFGLIPYANIIQQEIDVGAINVPSNSDSNEDAVFA